MFFDFLHYYTNEFIRWRCLSWLCPQVQTDSRFLWSSFMGFNRLSYKVALKGFFYQVDEYTVEDLSYDWSDSGVSSEANLVFLVKVWFLHSWVWEVRSLHWQIVRSEFIFKHSNLSIWYKEQCPQSHFLCGHFPVLHFSVNGFSILNFGKRIFFDVFNWRKS